MKHDVWPPPLRVEQALRVLPDVDALLPLRPFLIAVSRSRPPAEPYETVGKRHLETGELREMVPRAVALVTGPMETTRALPTPPASSMKKRTVELEVKVM